MFSERSAIDDVKPLVDKSLERDLIELQRFVPEINIKRIEDVSYYHNRLYNILNECIQKEINRLNLEIENLDDKINQIKNKVIDLKIPQNITQKTVDLCSELLEEKFRLLKINEKMSKNKEKYDKRQAVKDKLDLCISEIEGDKFFVIDQINNTLVKLSNIVAEGERIPVFSIIDDFGTPKIEYKIPGDSSESACFRGLILYDLAIALNCHLPCIIHDSSITSRLSPEVRMGLIKGDMQLTTQTFVAFQNSDLNDDMKDMINESIVADMPCGHELYGVSWKQSD